MNDRDLGIASYDDVLERIQEALSAVGALEKSIGDLGSEAALNATRYELSVAASALIAVRNRLAESIGR